MKFSILVDSSLVGHHYHILNLCDVYLGVEKIVFFKEIMRFHYMTYGHTLAQEPLPRGHEIYYFGRAFLGHHFYKLSLFEPCP